MVLAYKVLSVQCSMKVGPVRKTDDWKAGVCGPWIAVSAYRVLLVLCSMNVGPVSSC